MLGGIADLFEKVGQSPLMTSLAQDEGGSGNGGLGGVLANIGGENQVIGSNLAKRLVEALGFEESPTAPKPSGGGGGLFNSGALLNVLSKELQIDNPFSALKLKTEEMRDTLSGAIRKTGEMMQLLETTGPDGPIPTGIFDLLQGAKQDAGTGKAWFSEAETINRNLGGMLGSLFPKASQSVSGSLGALSQKVGELFETQQSAMSGLGAIFDGIARDGGSMLDMLAAGEAPPEGFKRTLAGKLIDQDAAWGRTEAQLGLTETQLTSIKDAAETAGLGADGALAALDGSLSGVLPEVATQGTTFADSSASVRDVAERIAALVPGDSAGAEALRTELQESIAAAKTEAEATRQKVDEATEETKESLNELEAEAAEITDATRLGFASFDFTPLNPGPPDNIEPAADLDKLLRSDVDDLLTKTQQRFRLDALFNTDHAEDRVVIDTSALFDALRARASAEGEEFDAIGAFAETVAWTYAHELAHTLGLPDLYDAQTGKELDGAGLMGVRGEFAQTDAQKDVIRFASDVPDAGDMVEVTRVLDMLRVARDAGVMDRGNRTDSDYLLAPPTGARPLTTTGWHVLGDVNEGPTDGIELREGGGSRTSAYRSFVIPPGATTFSFTLHTQLVDERGAPPDAIELALLDALGNAITVLPGLSNTDAALNLQANGTLRNAPELTITPATGGQRDFTSRRVTLDLTRLTVGARLALSLDLLGFGSETSRVMADGFAFDVPSVENNTPPRLTSGANVTLDEDGTALVDLRTLVTDAEGDALNYEITSPPARGTLDPVEPGVWRYKPAPDFNGTDGLLFTASDGVFRPLPVLLNLVVRPQNDAPTMTPERTETASEGDTILLQVQAVDPDGDTLAYSLETAVEGAVLTREGALTWTVPDGPATGIFRLLADDGQGGTARQTLRVVAVNAAPEIRVNAPAEAVVETEARLSLTIADPGDDPTGPVTVDWGDGTIETLPAHTTALSHVYDRLGNFQITVSAADDDGATGSATARINIVTPGLRVTSLTSGAWGVNVRFNEPVDTGLPNPYRLGGDTGEPIDVLLLDETGEVVRGSLVPDSDARGFTFIASDPGLAPGTYRLRLTGDTLGWRSKWDLLETGPEGYEERSFTVAEAAVRLKVDHAIQTPGEPLGPQGRGLSVVMSQSGGLRSIVLRAEWDADMMSMTGLTSGLSGVRVSRVDTGTTIPGSGLWRLDFDTPPDPGEIKLGDLMGRMHSTATYGSQGAPLRMSAVEINGVATASERAAGIRAFRSAPAMSAASGQSLTLAALRGDADGDGRRTGADAAIFAELPRDDLTGLDAWRLTDPNLLRPLPGMGLVTDPDIDLTSASGRGAGTGFDPYSPTPPRLGEVTATGSALSLFDNGTQSDADESDRLYHLSYSRPTEICLVDQGISTDHTGAISAGLCFEGEPRALNDPDQLWRLSGLRELTADEQGEDAERHEQMSQMSSGAFCFAGTAPVDVEEGAVFGLTARPAEERLRSLADGEGPPPQHLMCFEKVTQEPTTLEPQPNPPEAEQEAKAIPTPLQNNAHLTPFTALALIGAVASTAPRDMQRRKNRRHAILLGDDKANQAAP